MYKPVLVKVYVPGDKSHGTDYEGWEYTSHGLWKKKLVWKPFWKKYWKPGSKQVWITGTTGSRRAKKTSKILNTFETFQERNWFGSRHGAKRGFRRGNL